MKIAEQLDITAAESKTTFDEIKAYILQRYGMKVSNLYIAQAKQKYGTIKSTNYDVLKSKYAGQPQRLLGKE